MRFAPIVFLGFALVSASVSAGDDVPTAEEQKLIDAVLKVGGKASINSRLSPKARVVIEFETLVDTTLPALKKSPQFRQIGAIESFDAAKCTQKGLAPLVELPNLRKLVLGKSVLSSAGVNVIAQCKELRHLGLPDADLTDAEIVGLKKLTLLEHLSLNGNPKITDKGMLTVKSFERLQSLYLGSTSITDKALMELKGLDGLRTLNVANTKITADAAEKFADEMPNLRTVRR